MSAEDLGRRLLGGCVETTLDAVLKSLRKISDEQDVHLPRVSTLDQFLAPNQPTPAGRQPRLPVLELCSEDTGAGKSQLLYYIIMQAILPESHETTLLGGKDEAVVFFDTDAQFHVHRLVQIMASYIASKISEDEPIDDVQALVERSLQHVHIFQPRSMSALLESLQGLKKYLFDSSAHFSSNRAIHSIIIDSASAFHWDIQAAKNNDKLHALDAQAPGASAAAMPPPKPNPYVLLVNHLRSLQQALGCAVIATSTASRLKDANTGELIIKTLPAPWPSFPTARLVVKREQVRKFAVGISWEDAERDRMFRQEAVDKGHFVANPLMGGEAFRFVITKEGVRMVEEEERREMEPWYPRM